MGTGRHATSLRTKIATGLVILLFPGFYLYNAGLANGWFPQFLGGWFGPVSLLVGLPFLALLALAILWRGRVRDRIGVWVCVLVAYCLLWASLYTVDAPVAEHPMALYRYTLEFLWLWLVTYAAFRHFDYSSTRAARSLFALWLVMFAIALAGQQHGMYRAPGNADADAAIRIASYQGFARAALVTSALLLVRLRGWKALAFALAALMFLFLLGARTEFVGVLLVVGLSIVAGRGHWLAKTGALLVAGVLVAALAVQFGAVLDQSRVLNLLHLSIDASWQTRQLFASRAEDSIRAHWVLGAYGSTLADGGAGTYAHNALSAWVSFGLMGFVLFVGLNLWCLVTMLRVARRTRFRTSGLGQFALAMSAYAVACMVFAKNVADPIFAVAWGATAAVLADRHTRRVAMRRAHTAAPVASTHPVPLYQMGFPTVVSKNT